MDFLSMSRSRRVPRNSSLRISTYRGASMLPSIRQIQPKPSAVRHPQTITFPPPCFTTFFVYRSSNSSPGLLQHQERPSEPIRLNLDSSEKMTVIQSFTDQ